MFPPPQTYQLALSADSGYSRGTWSRLVGARLSGRPGRRQGDVTEDVAVNVIDPAH